MLLTLLSSAIVSRTGQTGCERCTVVAKKSKKQSLT